MFLMFFILQNQTIFVFSSSVFFLSAFKLAAKGLVVWWFFMLGAKRFINSFGIFFIKKNRTFGLKHTKKA